MALTIQQKLANLHAAEEAGKAALADLLNPATGESISPDRPAFDVASKTVYANVDGKLVRSRPVIIQAPKAGT